MISYKDSPIPNFMAKECYTCVRCCELQGWICLNLNSPGRCLILSFYVWSFSEQGLGAETPRGQQSLLAITIQTAFHSYLTLHSDLMLRVFSFNFHLRNVCCLEQGRVICKFCGSRTAAKQRWLFSWNGLSYLNFSLDQL